MNRKKIASLILATSIVTTQIATPVFAANTNDNTTNINSNEVVANDSTTRLVNNTTEFMEALKDSNIKNIKLNSDVTLKNDLTINRDLNVYGNRHSLDFANSRINSYKVINISFNDVSLKNGRSDNYGVICLNTANSKATFDNVNFNGPELLDAPNCTINLKGNCNFTTNSIQELFITGFINIEDGSNISINSKYNQGHWDGCSVLSTSWNNEKGGLTVGNNVNLTILTENNNACLGPSQLTNTNSFLKVGENSQVVFKNESSQKSNWRLAAYNVTKMDLADTATLDMSANNSWATVYSPAKFTWNLNNAHVKLSSNDTYYGLFGGSNGEINFGSSTNLQDVSIWSKDNTSEDANAIANDIYGTLNISGSSISSANISNPNLTSSLINSSTSGMSKLEFGIAKVDKSKLEELLNNKKDTTGMTPESAKKYEDALAAGQKVFDNPKATQQEVDDAVKAIENSSSALTPDKSGLQTAIDKAKDTLGSGKLIPDSEKVLKDAINKAEGVLNNPNATVSDINNAIKDLDNATSDVITSADKSKLEELLNNKVSIDGKTPESIKKYEDALAAGQKVFVNPNASQQEVDDAVKNIESALKNMNSSIASIASNFKEAYWQGNKLVFGGTFDILNTDVDQNSEKILIIKDNNGNIVKKINTWNASWNGNTGYQYFINVKDFESLSNGIYKLYVSTTINGATYESTVKQPKSLLRYIVHNNINDLESQRFGADIVKFSSNSDNDIIFTKELSVLTPSVNVKTMYFNESGLVVDGNLGFQGTSLDNPIKVKLLIKDYTGNTIETIDTWNASWGEKNTGFQGIISNEVLSKITKGEYTLVAKADFNGENYETKLVTDSSFKFNSVINDSFKIEVNATSDSVTFEKVTALKFDSSSEIKQSYWDGDNFVINGVVNIGDKVLDKNDIKKVVIKDSDGNQVGEVSTVSVDWFSKKGNFSGFQAIIPETLMEKLDIGTYSLEVQTIYNDIEYSNEIKQIPSLLRVFSIYKNVNDTEGKLFNGLLYKFATGSNSNVVLNIKENILPAQSIANNVYWQSNLNTYFINGGVTIDGKEMHPSESEPHMLVLKNSNGEVVSKSSEVVPGWNEENPYQAQINGAMINNLEPGTYTVYIKVTYDGKVYEAPIKLNKDLVLNTEKHQTDRYIVNVGLNSSKDLTITIK